MVGYATLDGIGELEGIPSGEVVLRKWTQDAVEKAAQVQRGVDRVHAIDVEVELRRDIEVGELCKTNMSYHV